LIREVAAYLEVDSALMSRVERGERSLNREQVEKIATFLNHPAEDFIALWMCEGLTISTSKINSGRFME